LPPPSAEDEPERDEFLREAYTIVIIIPVSIASALSSPTRAHASFPLSGHLPTLAFP
jgi:hypothetical protein